MSENSALHTTKHVALREAAHLLTERAWVCIRWAPKHQAWRLTWWNERERP